MKMSKRGKHSKSTESNTTKKIVLASTVVLGGGVVLPMVAATSAGAATSSAWDAVAQCESGGDWSINWSSDGMSVGGLQFQNASWHDALDYLTGQGYDTSSWTQDLYQGMPKSAVPTKAQTITAGEALLAIQGPSAWVCNGLVGSPLGASAFEGGAVPAEFITAAQSQGGGGGSTDTPPPVDPPATEPPAPDPAPAPHRHHDHCRHDDAQVDKTYTVVEGDWLAKIADREYGDWRKWPHIYEANKALIGDNPDLILPGQVLTIPAV